MFQLKFSYISDQLVLNLWSTMAYQIEKWDQEVRFFQGEFGDN